MSHTQRTQFESITRQMLDLSANERGPIFCNTIGPHRDSSQSALQQIRAVTTFPPGTGHHAFRMIATRLRRVRREQKLQRIMITSALAGEGKTFIAANLAIVLGMHSQERTLLIEGDLRQPSFPEMFNICDPAGLMRWFADNRSTADIAEHLYQLDGLNTYVLPAGEAMEDPTVVLDSDRISELLQWASRWFDWILIDSPPAVPVSDTSFWARYVEGVILVVSDGKTPKKLLRQALENLDSDRLIGTILNEASELDRKSYPYYTYYYGENQSRVTKRCGNDGMSAGNAGVMKT